MNQRLNQNTFLEGVRELTRKDEDLARILSINGPPPLWERQPGFPTLIHMILEQQVSLSSAKSAFNRLVGAVNPLKPEGFLTLDDDTLKQIGFSRQKTSYGRALAQAILDNSLDLSGLEAMEDEDARAQLLKIKGIGACTADVYLLMALGRPDIWPRGDLALEVALQRVKGLEKRPTSDEACQISETWRPWRAVAARILWNDYLGEQERERSSREHR